MCTVRLLKIVLSQPQTALCHLKSIYHRTPETAASSESLLSLLAVLGSFALDDARSLVIVVDRDELVCSRGGMIVRDEEM